jgi:hypothetical protein
VELALRKKLTLRSSRSSSLNIVSNTFTSLFTVI